MSNNYDTIRAAMAGDNEIIRFMIRSQTTEAPVKAEVYPTNTLGQIAEEYAKDIGIDAGRHLRFVNKATGEQTRDKNMTAGKFAISEDCILTIDDNGDVAHA